MKKISWAILALLTLSACAGNNPETCTVKFLNWDKSYLGADIVKYGETAEYVGTTPKGPDTAKYTYVFKGWDLPLENITSDCDRIAQYDKQLAKYDVRFVNYDGTLLYTASVDYDGTASYVGDTPTRVRDDYYEYAFTGWDVSLEHVQSALTATAQYQKTDRLYSVTFKNWDGSVLSVQTGTKGSALTYTGPAPIRPNDESGSFTFDGWSPYLYRYITSDATYIATFTHTLFTYKVTFLNWNGALLGTQTVSWGNSAGYNGTPSKEPTVEHAYEFTGWDKALSPIKADTTFTAQYREVVRQYDVKFVNYDGTVLEKKKVGYGGKTSYSLASDPARSSDDFIYTFTGWDKDPAVAIISGDTTFVATYSTAPNYAVFNFTLLEDGTYTVSGMLNYATSYHYSQLHVPATYQGAAVTAITLNAFAICTELTTVVLPDSITKIGASAFSGCSNLTALTLPKNLVSIESQAFRGTKIGSVVLPDSVTTIGYGAFSYCPLLKEATLPSGLASISNSLFDQCPYLEKVALGDKLTSIGTSAFESDYRLKDIVLPDTITTIGAHAFASCVILGQVDLPAQLKYVGEYAFDGCSSFDPTDMPSTLISLGSSAFHNCTSLKKATLPNSLTSLDSYCFQGCSSLAEVTIGSGLGTIGQNAFDGCVSLNKLTFVLGKLRYISLYSFENCTHLSEVLLPAGLTTIYSYAFSGCSGLTKVFIPSSVTSMDYYVFPSNYATKIYCEATAKPTYGWNVDWNSQCNNVYFYSESQPSGTGKYWHYVDGAMTAW